MLIWFAFLEITGLGGPELRPVGETLKKGGVPRIAQGSSQCSAP